MPYVSPEQTEQARTVDLLTYLQAYEPGAIRKVSPDEYCLIEHDSLKISANGKWHWHSRGFGGKDALTFLVKVRGIEFTAAVLSLCGGYAAPASLSPPITPPPKKKRPFSPPIPNADNYRAVAYLQSRGIDENIINRCIRAGTLYESKKYHNCVFIGRDTAGKARFACVRSTVNNFRQDIEGSDKRFCFSLPSANPAARFVMLAEAPIDILSLASMRQMDTEAADGYHYLSLGGTSPLALVQYLTDHPKIDRVVICLDNDTAGKKCMEKIGETLKTDERLINRDIVIIREPPPVGKDYNDTLQAIRQKQRELLTPVRSHEADFLL